MNLRTRAVRYWLTAIGALSIGVLYVAPTVEAFVLAPPAVALPNMAVPVAWFPSLASPKLHAPPKLASVKPY